MENTVFHWEGSCWSSRGEQVPQARALQLRPLCRGCSSELEPGPAGACQWWWGWGQEVGVDPVFSPSAILQYCHQLCVIFCCLEFTQVKMKKQWRSIEASKEEPMLALPCASPNYPRTFLAVPILEKGCDKIGEGGRKTSCEFDQCWSKQVRPRADGFHFSSHHKDQQVKKWGLKGYVSFFPPVSTLLRNKEKSRVLIGTFPLPPPQCTALCWSDQLSWLLIPPHCRSLPFLVRLRCAYCQVHSGKTVKKLFKKIVWKKLIWVKEGLTEEIVSLHPSAKK